VSHRCLPIVADPCFEAVLRCAGLDLDALDAIMARLLGELSSAALGDVLAIIEGILGRLAALEAALNVKLFEITDIEGLAASLDQCLVDLAVECTPIGNLVAMLLARRDELLKQVFELERNLDPIFGLPFQLAQFTAVLNEMICFQLNAIVTRETIDLIQNPPPPPPPDPTCPRP